LRLSGVTKSQALLILAHAGRLLLSIAIISLLGRMLAPADFGFVALVSSIYVLSLEFLDLGTTAVANREIAAAPAHERETLTALIALRRLLASLLFLAALGLAFTGYLAHGEQRIVIVAAALGIFLLHLHGYQVAFQVRQSYGQALALGLATQAGFLFASLALLKFHASGAAIAVLVVAREIVLALGIRWVAVRMLGYRLRGSWLHPGIGALFKAGWMIGAAGACYKLAAYSGAFFLWGMASPEALASFTAAQRLIAPMADMAWLFATPLIAALAAAFAHSAAEFRVQLEAYAKFIVAMSALAAVATYFLAPLLLRLLYGELYSSGPWSSVTALRWLALGYLFAVVTPVLAVGELAHGNARALMHVSLLALGLNAMVNTVAVPARGAEGAAMALCVSEAFACCVLFARGMARGVIGPSGAWTAYLLPAALLAVILSLLEGLPLLQLGVACAWVPAALLAILQLPAQRECRASLAAVSAQWPRPVGSLVPLAAKDS
jgi:O-antigen/teichoic acid export membrane protein